MKIFIIGVNGFIGNALARAILHQTDWTVIGTDQEKDRLGVDLLTHNRFEFFHGDITISREWVEFQIKRCDVIIPLAAVAIPMVYVKNPLLVFELDFLENLRIVQLANKYQKRLLFPSTSEVYGMAQDAEFDEENTNFVLGPIHRTRWIYSSSKQLLDRVIYAYGQQAGFRYTLFRPFNWVGPNLDRIDEHKIGNSRVVTQFISNVVFNRPLVLVDGGAQRRCMLYLDDGIDGLLKILLAPEDAVNHKIFNLGNPNNEVSMRELAELVIELYQRSPRGQRQPFTAGCEELKGSEYYGPGYQDMTSRRPSIRRAREILGWEPRHTLRETLEHTMAWFLECGLED